MIKIDKPTQPPISKKLKDELKVATDLLCKEYLTNKTDYDAGEKAFSFDNDLYKGGSKKEIKEQLLHIQGYKCCFCEQKLTNYDDVEHFRPKSAYQKHEGDILNYPAYYWLAYDWDNLLIACKVCNSSYKGNLFPLFNEDNRARNHLADISLENPLLINPATENPEDFIGFRRAFAYAKNERGRQVIEFFNLNEDRRSENDSYQDELYSERERIYMLVKNASIVANLSPTYEITQNDIDEAKARVELHKDNNEPFHAMIRANFP